MIMMHETYHGLLPTDRWCGTIVVDEVSQSVLIRVAVAKRHQCLEFPVSEPAREATGNGQVGNKRSNSR